MENENKKPEQKQTSSERTIAVKALRFPPGVAIDIGNQPAASGMSAKGESPGVRFTIDFIPSLRHHRISYYPPGKDSAPTIYMVHEQGCSWTPA